MNMFEAIFSRKSTRHFIHDKIEWDVLDDILKFVNEIPKLIDDIAVEFKLVSNIEKKQGFHGPFSVKAPYYFCISSEKKDNYLLNAGYMMQQLSLYLTRKGLGSCYVGLASPGRGLKSTMKYEYVIALAFGKPAKPLLRNSHEAKRLPEKDTVVYKEDVNADIRQIITAARLSPSGLNNQPWRFVVYKNRIHIFTRKNVLLYKMMDNNNLIDIGVMMAHFLIAAEELWIDVSISQLESLKNKPFQNNQYVLTVTIG
ncbi:MAG: hypothetical protein GX359_09045 [Clostridiales bacterium]|nr:hypothetical protein [Clostridiales bacterium]